MSSMYALMEQPILRTKISVPKVSPDSVPRPRLTERISRGVEGPLTLLLAPAGYGKTSLLIEWTEETGLAVAWLTLDPDDDDLTLFFRYVIAALQTIKSDLGDEALDFIQSTRGSGLDVGLTLLINEIATVPEDMVLVLDEFQVLRDRYVLRAVSFLLGHLPHNLHLVIASRTEPALDLAFLRSKRRVVELGTDDLRFTGEEVALFFQQTMGLQVSAETIRALEERTDGWITALQMAASSSRMRRILPYTWPACKATPTIW